MARGVPAATGSGNNYNRNGRPYIVSDDEGENCGPEGEIDEVAGETVGGLLNRSPRFPGTFYGLDNPPERRVASQLIRSDLQGARLIDGSRVNRASRGL